jgi:hypothetical protein
VSQPAPAVGQFKSARQEAAFGPEQASDFLLASVAFTPKGVEIKAERRKPSGEKPCDIEDTPSLTGVLAHFRLHSLASDWLYAGGAKTLELPPRPTPPFLFCPPFGRTEEKGREAQSRLGSRKFRLRRASPTGGSSSDWKNPGTVPEFSIGAARSIRCVANGQARGLRLGGSRG